MLTENDTTDNPRAVSFMLIEYTAKKHTYLVMYVLFEYILCHNCYCDADSFCCFELLGYLNA